MADHMHGMFAFALWDEENKSVVLSERPVWNKNRFTIMRQKMGHFFTATNKSEKDQWSSRDSKKRN